jgi:hypothetical protein
VTQTQGLPARLDLDQGRRGAPPLGFSLHREKTMNTPEMYYLALVVGTMGVFAVVLAWTEWYSNRA